MLNKTITKTALLGAMIAVAASAVSAQVAPFQVPTHSYSMSELLVPVRDSSTVGEARRLQREAREATRAADRAERAAERAQREVGRAEGRAAREAARAAAREAREAARAAAREARDAARAARRAAEGDDDGDDA